MIETVDESSSTTTVQCQGQETATTTMDDERPATASNSVKKGSGGHHMMVNDTPEIPFLHMELHRVSQAREKPVSFDCLVYEKKSEIDSRDADGKTALQVALELDLMTEANTLVLAGADVTLSNFYEQKLIHAACHGGQTEVVKSLLGKITNINGGQAEIENETPLIAACQEGHLDTVNLLLENMADANISDNDGWTPLHWACLCNQGRVVQRLLQVDGLNINAIEKDENWTPLNLAARKGHVSIFSQLLEQDADLYTTDSTNWTPLMTATQMDHLEIVKIILGKKTEWRDGYLEIRDQRNKTPLHVASEQGSCGIASELINAGADCDAIWLSGDDGPDLPYGPGWTPLHLACFYRQQEIVSLLLPEIPLPGVEVDVEAVNRRTPLHLASLTGNEIVAQLLLQRGADVNATDDRGCTPLHLASGYGPGWIHSIPELKVIPPDDNSCNDADPEEGCFGRPPRRYVPVMELLLRYGADLTLKDEYGDTALDHAAIVGDKPRIETLLKFMESDALAWEDWRQSPIYSALGGYCPHVAMKWLLSEQAVKNAPFWKNGGRVQVIKEASKVAKPFGILDLIFRELPSECGIVVTETHHWGPIQWVAHERLPCVLSKLMDDSGRADDFDSMVHDALQATSKSITPKELEDDTSCELLVQLMWVLITNSQRTRKNIEAVKDAWNVVRNNGSSASQAGATPRNTAKPCNISRRQVSDLRDYKKLQHKSSRRGKELSLCRDNSKAKATLDSSDHELWNKKERRDRHFGKEPGFETRKEVKTPTILGTLQDILKDPPFAQVSQTHRDEVNYKPPVPDTKYPTGSSSGRSHSHSIF